MNNKKAYYEYFILEEYTAGIKLVGAEVKSLRDGLANLEGAYCYIQDENKVFIKGMYIKEYENSCIPMESERVRELLLNKREIRKINKYLQTPGNTIVPLKVEVGKLIKIKIGVAKGKKNYDKRETIKERDITRENQREQA